MHEAHINAQDGGVSEIRVGSIDIAVPLSTAAAISLARAIHLSPASALWSASLLRITACLPELHRTVWHAGLRRSHPAY